MFLSKGWERPGLRIRPSPQNLEARMFPQGAR